MSLFANYVTRIFYVATQCFKCLRLSKQVDKYDKQPSNNKYKKN